MPKRLFILYLCLYISMIGYGLSLPVLPFFLEELAKYGDLTFSSISFHVGAVTAVFAFMQMISAPLWGKLSDYIGSRKFILLLGLAGYSISLALAGISKNIVMLYGARMLNGAFSGAVLPIASAYITDVTSKKHRARGLAWHGTSVGLGVVSGPALGSYISHMIKKHPVHLDFIDATDFCFSFLFASAVVLLPIIIAAIWLPESHNHKNAIPQLTQKTKNDIRGNVNVKKLIRTCLILSLLSQFALSLFEGTFVLHAQQVINFNASQLGKVFMVCGFVMAAAQGTIIAGSIEKFGPVKVLLLGFFSMGIALTALMTVRSFNQILIFVGILAFGMAMITPSIPYLISNRVENRLGHIFGLLTGANSIGQTLGPLIGSMLFIYNIHLPYLLTAGILFMVPLSNFLWNSVFRK